MVAARLSLRSYDSKAITIAVVAGFAAAAAAVIILLNCREASPIRSFGIGLEVFLESKVIASSPAEASDGVFHTSGKSYEFVAYVLGGTQDSLILKVRTVIGLCGSGKVKQIMLHSTPGITEYDESFGRNLTNDEWALKNLSGLWVGCRQVEFIRTEDGFFGTLSEAKAVRKAVLANGHNT
jgi:hypothetical protein